MSLAVPTTLKRKRQELREELAYAARLGGRTAEAARMLEDLWLGLEQAEEDALRPLGLLSSLANGNEVPELAAAVAMTRRVKANMPSMIATYREIAGALGCLSAAAREEFHSEYALVADELALQVQTDEEVLFPASVMLGEYLRLRHRYCR